MLNTPDADGLALTIRTLASWQSDSLPVQLHPGDLGWQCRFGIATTAAAVRTWSRDGRLLAIGLLDSATVLRLAISPEAGDDTGLAERLVADLSLADRVLPGGAVAVEARFGAAFQRLLSEAAWGPDEPWTPLRHDLSGSLQTNGLRIREIDADRAADHVCVVKAAFERSTFSTDRWHTMAAGPAYADARCLVGYHRDIPVAAVSVWSAGPGRPGLLEPMGVHPDHRGHGYGTAISVAAAAALARLGSSSAIVCTPTANVGGIATYRAAGYREAEPVPDFGRAGSVEIDLEGDVEAVGAVTGQADQ